MLKLVDLALEKAWTAFPDTIELEYVGNNTTFTINRIDDQTMVVPRPSSSIRIPRHSLLAALDYLLQHGHTRGNPCEIRSDYNKPGPLNVVTQAGSRVTVMYVVPILRHMGLVEIDSTQPATTWLAEVS